VPTPCNRLSRYPPPLIGCFTRRSWSRRSEAAMTVLFLFLCRKSSGKASSKCDFTDPRTKLLKWGRLLPGNYLPRNCTLSYVRSVLSPESATGPLPVGLSDGKSLQCLQDSSLLTGFLPPVVVDTHLSWVCSLVASLIFRRSRTLHRFVPIVPAVFQHPSCRCERHPFEP